MENNTNNRYIYSTSIEEIWNKAIFHIEETKIENKISIQFYLQWKSICTEDSNLKLLNERYTKYKEVKFHNFREQIVLSGVSLMVSYFFDEELIRISSPALSNELYLINQLKQMIEETRSSNRKVKSLQDHVAYLKFKEHISKIASMDSSFFPSIFEVTSLQNSLAHLEDEKYKEVNVKASHITQELLEKVREYKPNFFEKITDFSLQLTAMFALLRVHQLKFVAILPSLDGDFSGREVKRVLLESLRRLVTDSNESKSKKTKGEMRALPQVYIYIVNIVYHLARYIPAKTLASLVRAVIRLMAKRFIAGENIETANKSLLKIFRSNRDVTLDQLGELVVSEKEALNYQDEVLKLINGYSLHINKGRVNDAGILRAHVSIKVSALCSSFVPEAFDYTYHLVAPKLKRILLAAKEADVFLNIDAEHYHYRDIVFEVYKKILLETTELSNFSGTGIVVQAYLRDASSHLKDIIELAKTRGITMPIRLVKGAYWDAETIESDAHGYDAPEFLNKEETDLHFRQLIILIFDNYPHIQLCLASHNFSDHAFAESLRITNYKDLPVIEHQCLHMTYEALSIGMTKMNWTVRNYVPIGSLIVGMAYLVRRIMENSSQVGVLTIMRSHNRALSLVSPMEIHLKNIANDTLVRDISTNRLTSDFLNVTPLRLYRANEFYYMKEALINKKFLKEQIVENDSNQFMHTGAIEEIYSSSNLDQLVGKITFATIEDTNKAIEKLDSAFIQGEWRELPPAIRSAVLIKAGAIMLAKRNDLSALICYEAGKSVEEALADVDEAYDFLNFYARAETDLSLRFRKLDSRGVVAVIAPWNFPLAIPCGMVASALVAGNHVALKSAEQTPLIARELVNIFYLAGVGRDVLIHLPGTGETVGDFLVKDPRVAGIIFTGSKAVGQMIYKSASTRIYHNKVTKKFYPVKVITEMGGKNAIIVSANAELDETVAEIMFSSFAHAGQKCSACSRVIVHNSIKKRLIERIKEACLDIKVGSAFDFETKINPVVCKDDQKRLRKQIKEAGEECKKFGGRIIVDRAEEDFPGLCVGPAVFELPFVRAQHIESFARKELFGPVLHIIGYDHFDEAIHLYNCTEYALTGGVFCQSEDDIEYLKPRLQSGNIYVNRSITGARVGIEPFGGFKLSGTGPKAGGIDYLKSMHVFNQNQENDDRDENKNNIINEEAGSHYDFDLKTMSKLSNSSRKIRFDKSIIQLIMVFENIYDGLEINKKRALTDFQNWVRDHYLDLVGNRELNRIIPGQLSYNKYNLIKEKTVFLAYNSKPDLNMLLNLLTSILVGTGVTLLCRNEKVFTWWNHLIHIFHTSGFSKENLDVYFCNESLLKRAIQARDVDLIIIDLPKNNQNDSYMKLVNIINKVPVTNNIKQVITNLDGHDVTDYRSLLLQFIKVRSFAVNIMRHGTKMDVNDAGS